MNFMYYILLSAKNGQRKDARHVWSEQPSRHARSYVGDPWNHHGRRGHRISIQLQVQSLLMPDIVMSANS